MDRSSHEHTDVAVIDGQNPRGHGNADKMAEYEFRFDRADTDAIGLLDGENGQVWPARTTSTIAARRVIKKRCRA